MNDEPLLIKVNEACKLMNIGKNKMYQLVNTKGFPAIIFLSKNRKKTCRKYLKKNDKCAMLLQAGLA